MSCFSCFPSSQLKKVSRRFDISSRIYSSRKYDVSEEARPVVVVTNQSEGSNKKSVSRRSVEPTAEIPSVKTTTISIAEIPSVKPPATVLTVNNESGNGNIAAESFTFRELASATNNFRSESLIGEGGFGRVYKGCLVNTGQLAAVKQMDRTGLQGNTEFLVEVLMLSLLHNENLVNLIGYCADGDQRLLVYEYMPLGSLEDHLLEISISPNKKPLSWPVRMKIAFGAAKGLEYLHEKANPPVIYRDLKSANILLDEEFNPKLSDFGLAKLGTVGDKVHVSSRVMGTYGYCAPEYARTGQLTMKSDVYSFGVVLLELITGRRVIDTTKEPEEENLVTWAEAMFKDQKRYPDLVDPLLEGDCPVMALNQAVAVAAMCLQEEASIRPLMADVVTALSCLATPDLEVTSARSSDSSPPSKEAMPMVASDCIILGEEIAEARERAVAEAIRWGSNNQRSCHDSNL